MQQFIHNNTQCLLFMTQGIITTFIMYLNVLLIVLLFCCLMFWTCVYEILQNNTTHVLLSFILHYLFSQEPYLVTPPLLRRTLPRSELITHTYSSHDPVEPPLYLTPIRARTVINGVHMDVKCRIMIIKSIMGVSSVVLLCGFMSVTCLWFVLLCLSGVL